MRIDNINHKLFQAQPKTDDFEDAKLRRACQEFEAVFTAQLLKKMRDTVPKADLFGSKDKEEIFQTMLDQEIAMDISKTGALKLGELMYQQLSKKG